MPFRPVSPETRAAAVIAQIEQLILRGILRPGERLPAERDLADRLAVSRPSLREAIAALQESGLLSTRRGAGVYVADVLGNAFSPALIDLFARHEEAVADYLSFRRDMEALAAERAAGSASDTDLAVIKAILDKMETAQKGSDIERQAQLDAQFHMAIIEASHNVVMLHMMRSMYDLLRGGVFYNRQMVFRQTSSRDDLLAQHRAINAALQTRNAPAARAAVEAHLDFVAQAVAQQHKAAAREDIARRRLQHEAER